MTSVLSRMEDREPATLGLEERLFIAQFYVMTGFAVDRARALINRVLEEARADGAIGVLPYGFRHAFYVRLRDGDWASAYADAAEGTRLAADVGNVLWQAFALGQMALVEAAQGRERECRDHAREALAQRASTTSCPSRRLVRRSACSSRCRPPTRGDRATRASYPRIGDTGVFQLQVGRVAGGPSRPR